MAATNRTPTSRSHARRNRPTRKRRAQKGAQTLIVYHGTTRSAATTIERDGFKDATGTYLTARTHKGVWVSNVRLDVNDTSREYDEDSYFAVEVAEEEIAQYEWPVAFKQYREWLVPAKVLNGCPRRRLSAEQYWDLSQARFFPMGGR